MSIHCSEHGDSEEAYICKHLLKGSGLGFHVAANHETPTPDAWCGECEKIRLQYGNWDEGGREPKIALVCAACYRTIRARNLMPQQIS